MTRSVGLLRLERETTAAACVGARAGEFFGGIWFKIFSERGPSPRADA
jgi:hypothetical protein